MGRIEVQDLPRPEGVPASTWCDSRQTAAAILVILEKRYLGSAREQPSAVKMVLRPRIENQAVSLAKMSGRKPVRAIGLGIEIFVVLEPCAMKVACTVLRGEGFR